MISEHFPNIKALIIDMDGVLWRDTQPLGDLREIFNILDKSGYRYILATNNATRSLKEYLEKITQFGVELNEYQVISTALALGLYLKREYPQDVSAYVIGQPSLIKTLESHGIQVVNEDGRKVDVVVASLDYSLTYAKLKQASLLIQSGCDFIGTNSDPTLPTPEGLIPGSGTVIGALEIASGKKARMIGKPEPLLYEMAMDRLGCKPDETLAIGDRLETDIVGAYRAGIHSVLVLTGAATKAQAANFSIKPELIIRSLEEFVK